MAKERKYNYPYPLLAEGCSDYSPECVFRAVVNDESICIDGDDIVVPVSYELVSQFMTKLLSERSAEAIAHVECSATSYSEVFKFDNCSRIEVRVPKFRVLGSLSIKGLIVAARPIESFDGEGEFNDGYFGETRFAVNKGDILAIGEPHRVFLDDAELEKPVSSIFGFKKNNLQVESLIPEFEGESIVVNLCEETFDKYQSIKSYGGGILTRFLNGVLVFPVLVEAIELMRNENDHYKDFKWYRVIERQAENRGIDPFDSEALSSTRVADALLGEISKDALKRFSEAFESLNDGEQVQVGGID